MGRRQWLFTEPAARVVVTIDTTLTPKKEMPVPRVTPKADALANMIAEYIARECGDQPDAWIPRIVRRAA